MLNHRGFILAEKKFWKVSVWLASKSIIYSYLQFFLTLFIMQKTTFSKVWKCTGVERSPFLRLTSEGFRDVLFLPLPGLVVLIRGPLVILGQTALSLVLRGGRPGPNLLLVRTVVELRAAPPPIWAVLELWTTPNTFIYTRWHNMALCIMKVNEEWSCQALKNMQTDHIPQSRPHIKQTGIRTAE